MLTYKKDRREIQSFHSLLRYNHGSATKCENKKCKNKSFIYEWALKRGHKYSATPSDYLQLCRSCHRKYDLTPKKRQLAIKNLWWKKGVKNPAAMWAARKVCDKCSGTFSFRMNHGRKERICIPCKNLYCRDWKRSRKLLNH